MMPTNPSSSARPRSSAAFKKYGRRLILQGLIAVAALAVAPLASAETLIWDGATGTAGQQEGPGTWSTGATANWWDGTQNVVWVDGNFAQFGNGGSASSKSVTVSGTVTVGGIIFGAVSSTPGYTLNGGNIAIADGGTISLNNGATSAQAFATINSVVSGADVTIQKSGDSAEEFLGLTADNTWTGKLTIASGAGGIFVRTSNGDVLNTLTTVEVGAGNTLSLLGNNTTYTSDFIVAGAGSGGRGAIRFDNNMTLSGTITLAGDTVLNFQSSTPTAANVIFTGAIVGDAEADFTKTGLGTLTLRGASSYQGATSIATEGSGAHPGTLLLDFANSTTIDNLLYHDVDASVLVLEGNSNRSFSESTATLAIQGKEGTINSQTFAALSVTGPTAITVASGVSGSANLSLGSIIRSANGTLALTGPASGSITTATNPGTLLGVWATYTNAAGVTTWAGTDNSGVLGLFTGEVAYGTGTDLSAYGGEINLVISSNSTGPVTQNATTATVGTVTMADTADRVISVGTGNQFGADGVQLISGAGNLTIGTSPNTGSFRSSNNESELFLSNFSPTSLLTVNSVIIGGVQVTLNGTGRTIFTGTNTYSGTTNVTAGILEVRANGALGTTGGRTIVGHGGTLQLSGGVTTAEPLTLSGDGAAGSGALLSTDGDNAVTGSVLLSGPTRIVATEDSRLTLSGAVGGSAALTKAGEGMLVLGANNTYTGSTFITEGALRITSAASLGNVSAGTNVSAGAALELSSATALITNAEFLSLNGAGVDNGGALRNVTGNNTYRGAITLQTDSRINSDAGTLTLDVASGNAISGATQSVTFGGAGDIVVADTIAISTGTVTKDGTGTLTLSGANTYTGVTTVLDGTLALGANDVFASAASLTVAGGTFSIGAFSDALGAVILQSGAITGTTGVLTGSSYNVQSGTVDAILGGTANLTKTTSGTVTLSGANTYSGTTFANAGRLILDYGSGAVVLAAGNAVTLGGGFLEFRGGTTPTPIELGVITMATNTGMSTLVVGENAAITAADLMRNSGSTIFIDLSAAGSSLAFTTAPRVVHGQVVGTNGSNNAVAMKDSNGRYDFAALGAGNTVTRLNSSTALVASGGSATTSYLLAADSTFSLTGNVGASSLRIDTTEAAGTLDLGGHVLNLSLFGVLVDGSNDFTITNGALAGSNVAVFLYQFSTGTVTLDSAINSGQVYLMGTGLIDWTAETGVTGAAHVYGATVRVSGNALSMGATGTGNTGNLAIGSSGILELGSGDFTRSLGGAAGNVRFVGEGGFSAYGADRTVNIGGNTEAPLTLTWGSTSHFLASGSKLILGSQYANATVDFKNGLNLNGANQTVEVLSPNSAGIGGKISGNISGTGASSLTKTGQGILTLAGNNSYTGSTFVNEGVLYVTGSLSDNVSVEVAGGAELQLAEGGAISAGALALDDAATFGLEVGTLTAPPISISGTTTLTGSITLALTLIADPTDGILFTLIDSAMLAGYETGARFYYNGIALNEGDLFLVSNGGFSQQFQFSYQGGSDGADVTALAVVPEPSTAAVLLASTGLLLGLNRFRRRSR